MADFNYKTKMCSDKLSGECRNDSCKWAHSYAELEKGMAPNSLDNYKTRKCLAYERNEKCVNGPGCHFYHEFAEKREVGKEKKDVACPFFSKTGLCYFDAVPESCPYHHNQ